MPSHWRGSLRSAVHGGGPGANKQKCFPLVAAPYAGDAASGPLEYVDLATSDAGVPDANSRNQSPPERSFIVTVGLQKPLQLENPLDPPFLLRFASKSGSLNQALDCDAAPLNLEDEVRDGCETEYALNYDNWDKDPSTPYTWDDITCSAYPSASDLPPPAFINDPTPNCIALAPNLTPAPRQATR